MTAVVEIALEALVARVEAAARAGTVVTRQEAIALLRVAGLSRDSARSILVSAAAGRWTLTRSRPGPQGGRPGQTLRPAAAPVVGVVAAAQTHPCARRGGAVAGARPRTALTHGGPGMAALAPALLPEPVDCRHRLLAAARAIGFPRCEYCTGHVIPTGEPFWQRFAALADADAVALALRVLGGTP